jgi:aryl-alcohol dehydrogenase
MTTSARAAVLRHPGQGLEIEDIEIEAPRPDEVIVKLVSAGICKTDEHAFSQVSPPAVLGHEGAGVVEQVGAAVTKVQPGDSVVMTFATCGVCPRCRRGQVAYCDRFIELNFTGRRLDGSSALSAHGEVVGGHFLGQSCFATHALAHERSLVRVDGTSDLRPLGPFGCGFQTGAGAVINALHPPAGSSIAVFGAGAVGMAAIAASSLVGCDPIVAIDISASRLETARRFGATAVIDATSSDVASSGIAAHLAALAPGGLDYALDTTGVASVLRQAVDALNTRGTCAVVGAGPSEELVLDWRTVLNGRTITGIIGGNSVPEVFIPKLLSLYQSGRFRADELIEYFPFEAINSALEASARGSVVKPVLTFS